MQSDQYYKDQITRLQSLIQAAKGSIRADYAKAIRLAQKRLRKVKNV